MVSFAAKVGFVTRPPGSGSMQEMPFEDNEEATRGENIMDSQGGDCRPRNHILNGSFRDEFDGRLSGSRTFQDRVPVPSCRRCSRNSAVVEAGTTFRQAHQAAARPLDAGANLPVG